MKAIPVFSASEPAITHVPGMAPIELVAYYSSFREYYSHCEPETMSWCANNVKEDWTVLDCGANIGYFTILFSRLASSGVVHAIEPTSTYDMLMENVLHHACTNVVAHKLALGKHSARMHDSIFRVWGEPAEAEQYEFISIDRFVERFAIATVDLIKIDVDGFDFEVLEGAQHTLRTHKPCIIVELNEALGTRGIRHVDVFRLLRSINYTDALVLDRENYVWTSKDSETGLESRPNSISIAWPV